MTRGGGGPRPRRRSLGAMRQSEPSRRATGSRPRSAELSVAVSRTPRTPLPWSPTSSSRAGDGEVTRPVCARGGGGVRTRRRRCGADASTLAAACGRQSGPVASVDPETRYARACARATTPPSAAAGRRWSIVRECAPRVPDADGGVRLPLGDERAAGEEAGGGAQAEMQRSPRRAPQRPRRRSARRALDLAPPATTRTFQNAIARTLKEPQKTARSSHRAPQGGARRFVRTRARPTRRAGGGVAVAASRTRTRGAARCDASPRRAHRGRRGGGDPRELRGGRAEQPRRSRRSWHEFGNNDDGGTSYLVDGQDGLERARFQAPQGRRADAETTPERRT